MGILKIRQRGPRKNKNQKQNPGIPVNFYTERNPDYDSDEHEVAEVGCELALFGGEIYNIPYELYTLPDLTEILSLETWNLCLTEDERFSLTAYLPDLDQEMFWLTVKELLSGDNMFFGNPLDKLLQKLKGGLYSPRVGNFTEAMKLLQKRKYYHFLRSYHETMTERLEDMSRSWNDLQPTITVQERIDIWKRKQQKPVLLVDLNAFPTDEDVPTSSFDSNMLNTQVFSRAFPSLSLNKNTKAKGVLKIKKPVDLSSVENQMVRPSVSNTVQVHRHPPKGVLKIKGKSDHLSQAERSYDFLELPISRISPPKFATQWHRDNNINGLPLLHQSLRDGRDTQLPDLNSHRKENYLTSGIDAALNAQSSKKKNSLRDIRLHSIPESQAEIFPVTTFEMLAEETGKNRGYHCGASSWPDLDPSSSVPSGSSIESYSFPLKRQRRRGNAKTKAKPETSHSGDRMLHSCLDSKLKLEKKHVEQVNGIEKPSDNYTVSDVQRENPMFPLTYKRKKPFTKLNPVDSDKKLAKSACSEQNVSGSDGHGPQKSGGLRIRFKPLSDYNVHYKQGMLNELQLGSSSTQGI